MYHIADFGQPNEDSEGYSVYRGRRAIQTYLASVEGSIEAAYEAAKTYCEILNETR